MNWRIDSITCPPIPRRYTIALLCEFMLKMLLNTELQALRINLCTLNSLWSSQTNVASVNLFELYKFISISVFPCWLLCQVKWIDEWFAMMKCNWCGSMLYIPSNIAPGWQTRDIPFGRFSIGVNCGDLETGCIILMNIQNTASKYNYNYWDRQILGKF